jgi:hypothetical protein
MEGGGKDPIYKHPQFIWVVAIIVVLLLLCVMSNAEKFELPKSLDDLMALNPFAKK